MCKSDDEGVVSVDTVASVVLEGDDGGSSLGVGDGQKRGKFGVVVVLVAGAVFSVSGAVMFILWGLFDLHPESVWFRHFGFVWMFVGVWLFCFCVIHYIRGHIHYVGFPVKSLALISLLCLKIWGIFSLAFVNNSPVLWLTALLFGVIVLVYIAVSLWWYRQSLWVGGLVGVPALLVISVTLGVFGVRFETTFATLVSMVVFSLLFIVGRVAKSEGLISYAIGMVTLMSLKGILMDSGILVTLLRLLGLWVS